MKAVVMVVFVEAIPFMVLYGVLGSPLGRRSRFWLRFAGIVIAMLLPVLVAILAPVGEQTALMLLLVGFGWGFWLPCRRALCSSMDGVSTREGATMTVGTGSRARSAYAASAHRSDPAPRRRAFIDACPRPSPTAARPASSSADSPA